MIYNPVANFGTHPLYVLCIGNQAKCRQKNKKISIKISNFFQLKTLNILLSPFQIPSLYISTTAAKTELSYPKIGGHK